MFVFPPITRLPAAAAPHATAHPLPGAETARAHAVRAEMNDATRYDAEGQPRAPVREDARAPQARGLA
jgi:hypothetical protein